MGHKQASPHRTRQEPRPRRLLLGHELPLPHTHNSKTGSPKNKSKNPVTFFPPKKVTAKTPRQPRKTPHQDHQNTTSKHSHFSKPQQNTTNPPHKKQSLKPYSKPTDAQDRSLTARRDLVACEVGLLISSVYRLRTPRLLFSRPITTFTMANSVNKSKSRSNW
ncbi:hypothetical protein HDF14_000250 [Edaphobacter lichenicola]|uniref:Uncharacterized protein n=1 Tax=Tunturiibacter gelidiferens TaxID=3069689 RepID=A0A9X0Q9R5_9BACT|nr:hypothetical protein [Edaphobacter lichenicola]